MDQSTDATLSNTRTLRQRLEVIEKKRATSDPLPEGSGPFTSSDRFRLFSSQEKPLSKRWDHHFSREALSQVASKLKIASRGTGPPGARSRISLGTGRPATQYFPWSTLTMSAAASETEKAYVHIPSMSCAKGDHDFDLDIAMNYGFSAGAPQTLRFITEHVEMIHDPPYRDWACSVTCGSTSALEIVLRLFCTRGDNILAERYTYPGTVSTALLQGLNKIPITMDEEGLCPADLNRRLEQWDESQGPKPRVLYMIPSGQNPTGTTQSLSRRNAIYDVAEQHDLLILEDDPYYFLHLGVITGTGMKSHTNQDSLEGLLSQLPPSYLSLDVSGRVLRLDTTSKILSPGLRFGWITASSQVIDKFVFHSEASVLSPGGPSQVLIYKLLDQAWGHQGFLTWLNHLSSEYRHRRDIIVRSCQSLLRPDICQWTIPMTGMFLWIRLSLPSRHYMHDMRTHEDLEEAIYTQSLEEGVLVSKGSWFVAKDAPLDSICFRMSFATASAEEMHLGVQRFAQVIDMYS